MTNKLNKEVVVGVTTITLFLSMLTATIIYLYNGNSVLTVVFASFFAYQMINIMIINVNTSPASLGLDATAWVILSTIGKMIWYTPYLAAVALISYLRKSIIFIKNMEP